MRETILTMLFHSLEMVGIESCGNGFFQLIEIFPDWFKALHAEIITDNIEKLHPEDIFPALKNMLDDAETFWETETKGRLTLGRWTETDPSGNIYPLQAMAISSEKKKLLLITCVDLGSDWDEREKHLEERITGLSQANKLLKAELLTSHALLNQAIAERKRLEEVLQENEIKYREISLTDELTQLYTSQHFFHQLKNEIERASRYKHPLSLLIMRINNFADFYEKYGYFEGNKVLARLGEVTQECLRTTDTGCRYGNEEFAVILPETDLRGAVLVAERLKRAFKMEKFYSTLDENVLQIAFSIGVVQYSWRENMLTFVERAENNMYAARTKGHDHIYFTE